MKQNVIEIKNLYKKYKLGTVSIDTFADDILVFGKNIKKKITNKFKDNSVYTLDNNDIWALKNININIKQGEIVGIIGNNGAGKSTLLKILSRITLPTSGEINIKGRIASLLEVGTGFHPELTGKENIYLNGAILGMRKYEIDNNIENIIEFSGVHKFINTPVKRFSSGMRVRLAFSIAAHLDPEILLIDEVLAVGDADFQKKCLKKMENIAGNGRTILFVSHNMSAIESLCTSAVVLEQGEVKYNESATKAIQLYFSGSLKKIVKEYKYNQSNATGDERLKILNIKVEPFKGKIISVKSGITFTIKCLTTLEKTSIFIGLSIYTHNGIMLTHSYTPITDPKNLKSGFYTTKSILPNNILNKGLYYVIIWYGISNVEKLAEIKNKAFFEVMSVSDKTSTREVPGIINPDITFKHVYSKK